MRVDFANTVLFGAVAPRNQAARPARHRTGSRHPRSRHQGREREGDRCARRDLEERDDLGEPAVPFRKGGSDPGQSAGHRAAAVEKDRRTHQDRLRHLAARHRRCSGSPKSRSRPGTIRSCTRCPSPSARAAGFRCRTRRRCAADLSRPTSTPPTDVLAVMSAKNDPKAKRNGDYTFVMPDAIPPYLIALAVGDLRFKETGPRTGVYAEKSLMSAAAKEFADAEALIRAARRSFGPYPWSRYDILVLPPSFPVGGMENPRLSFVSPTIITGRQAPARGHRARSGAFLAGRSGQQRNLARCVAQRGIRRLPAEPHRGCRCTASGATPWTACWACESLRDELADAQAARIRCSRSICATAIRASRSTT